MLTVATFATALLNIPLVWLMVRWNGAMGAAQATMLTMLSPATYTDQNSVLKSLMGSPAYWSWSNGIRPASWKRSRLRRS